MILPAPPTLSHTQMLILLGLALLFAIPSGILLKRAGRNPLWAVLWFVPALALIGLWALALMGPKQDT
jgi:hypothetical protein